MKVSSCVATILLLLSIVAMATNANTSGYFAPESSPKSGFLCTFTSTVSPSTITPGTPSVTVSGTDTCDPSGSYLYAALLPGNPKLVDYLSDPCDSIESAINKGTYEIFPSANGPTNNAWNYAEIWGITAVSGYSSVENFALTDSSGQFSGNYPTSPPAPPYPGSGGNPSSAPPLLKPGGYCILLQVPCQIIYATNGGFMGLSGVCQAPVYDNLDVVESSSPSTSTITTPICFTCYVFTSATSSSPTCSAFLCSFATISQPPVVTNTLPPATMITQTEAFLETDWAVISVSMNPPAPTVGQTVIFSMAMTAVSSSGSFPQNVYVQCVFDGANCGRGTVSYPGPIGFPFPVNANHHPWQATPGTHTLTWMISTDNDPNPSNNVISTTFTVGQTTTQPANITQPVPDFTINTSPPSQTALQGQTISYSVNVEALNGFNSPVSVSVSGLPSGANGVFSNPSATPNFASTLTVTLPENVSTGSFTLAVTGSGGGLSHVANLVLTVSASSVMQTSSTQTTSDLMSMIQQNQLLILGGIVLLAAIIIAVALRGQRKPTQSTKTDVTTGTIYCRKCGTQNSDGHEFCVKCGAKLH
ncbi:MAG: zinc-ribbon domain-containing protein [Candidatus Bathyarchaeia archaeon]